jgi:putative Mg2+ transporter-C (MgtC) family protein
MLGPVLPHTSEEAAKLALAYLLAIPTGWYREKETHSIGIRTFPLVAVASCGYVLLAAPPGQFSVDAQSRVVQGLVTGIGFIGGGAILKSTHSVHGTATAASIWNTGVIGAAVAQNRYSIAIVLAVLNFITLRLLVPLKARLDHAESSDVERQDDE